MAFHLPEALWGNRWNPVLKLSEELHLSPALSLLPLLCRQPISYDNSCLRTYNLHPRRLSQLHCKPIAYYPACPLPAMAAVDAATRKRVLRVIAVSLLLDLVSLPKLQRK